MQVRKRRGMIAVLLWALLASGPAWGWEGWVVAAVDGDSLEVNQGGRVGQVRLYGIDCPEYGQSGWLAARELTRALALGQRVRVEPMDRDGYGRTVALVWNQGQLVNRELVRHGQAWVYRRYCRSQPLCSELDDLEQAARRAGLGLWQERAPEPPWAWRHHRP